jgi:UDP-N-acetylmuramate--L-alanine ligase/UDP-N-acetylenolpyruvoylglucosamine reductase
VIETMNTVRRPSLFGRDLQRLHCVGVAGMGVGPLAINLAQLGFSVTGEDDAMTEEMRTILTRGGVRLEGMRDDCELVVYSSAIAEEHPVYRAARSRRLPLVRRGELLAEVTRDRKLVAICGSHGKTTTTAMLITALRHGEFPAGYVLGGLFADDTLSAAAGDNEWVVAEIDESDGTIGQFAPEVTVAVNLDWDHPDHYRRREDIETAFAGLFRRTKAAVLTSASCPMSRRVVESVRGEAGAPRFQTFGAGGDFASTVRSEKGARLTLALSGAFGISEANVRARGAFNASNATAALAAAEIIGAPVNADSLASYPAVRRRQSVLHEGAFVALEDYAHHPAEIAALLASLRPQVRDGGRLIVAFQPHRYSRTAQFKGEFAQALAAADSVHLVDVYPAGEAPVAGGTTADLQAEMARVFPQLPVDFAGGDQAALAAHLTRDVHPGDLVAFVGAGDIDRRARAWLASGGASAERNWDAFIAQVQPKLASGTKLKREEPLAGRTTLRVGGAARVYAEPASLADLQCLLREAAQAGVPVYPLGRGSNLLVPDAGVNGLVLSLARETWCRFEPTADGRVWVGAGLRLKNLCGLAAKAGLVGFEFLEGIPGSVGGALRMNAGAMGGWTFDVVEEVELMTLAGEVKRLPKAAMHVDYRHCAELHDAIALGALLRPASNADAEQVKRQMDAYARKRHETQPREPSAGCIFKNPPGDSAGRLIDQCGLKGERVGDAEVSAVHGNFIINRGKATSADVIELVRRIRRRVTQAKGIDLHPEVLLYGQNWEDVL